MVRIYILIDRTGRQVIFTRLPFHIQNKNVTPHFVNSLFRCEEQVICIASARSVLKIGGRVSLQNQGLDAELLMSLG